MDHVWKCSVRGKSREALVVHTAATDCGRGRRVDEHSDDVTKRNETVARSTGSMCCVCDCVGNHQFDLPAIIRTLHRTWDGQAM